MAEHNHTFYRATNPSPNPSLDSLIDEGYINHTVKERVTVTVTHGTQMLAILDI